MNVSPKYQLFSLLQWLLIQLCTKLQFVVPTAVDLLSRASKFHGPLINDFSKLSNSQFYPMECFNWGQGTSV